MKSSTVKGMLHIVPSYCGLVLCPHVVPSYCGLVMCPRIVLSYCALTLPGGAPS